MDIGKVLNGMCADCCLIQAAGPLVHSAAAPWWPGQVLGLPSVYIRVAAGGDVFDTTPALTTLIGRGPVCNHNPNNCHV